MHNLMCFEFVTGVNRHLLGVCVGGGGCKPQILSCHLVYSAIFWYHLVNSGMFLYAIFSNHLVSFKNVACFLATGLLNNSQRLCFYKK